METSDVYLSFPFKLASSFVKSIPVIKVGVCALFFLLKPLSVFRGKGGRLSHYKNFNSVIFLPN